MAREVIFAQMLQQLMTERYRRNRSALAAAASISTSALSQYVRGRATPSLDVLVHLAETLGVSLDYLVFGRDRVIAPPPELGYLPYLDAHIRSTQVQSEALYDLVSRVGARLGQAAHAAAAELLEESGNQAGTLSPADVADLERCSVHTAIVTTDLNAEFDVLLFRDDTEATPTVFAQVVAENIKEGTRYEYFVPQGPEWTRAARALRQGIVQLGGFDSSYIDKYLKIIHVNSACVPGFVVQHVPLGKFQRQATDVFDRVERFIYHDPENEEMGFIAYVDIINSGNQSFNLIIKENVPRLLQTLKVMHVNGESVDR
jgi:transcriptional regulator with XRE-family HTH domain